MPSAIAPVLQSQPFASVPGPSSVGVPGPGTFARLACVKSSSEASHVKNSVPSVATEYHALSRAVVPLPTPVLDNAKDVITGT